MHRETAGGITKESLAVASSSHERAIAKAFRFENDTHRNQTQPVVCLSFVITTWNANKCRKSKNMSKVVVVSFAPALELRLAVVHAAPRSDRLLLEGPE
jgi:hypothetical protein